MISFLLFLIGIPPLPFALGMFIPLPLNTPLIVGGLLSYFMKKETKKQSKELSKARTERGTLIASGMIAGAAIFGVLGAFLLFAGVNLDTGLYSESGMFAGNVALGEALALVAFVLLIIYFA